MAAGVVSPIPVCHRTGVVAFSSNGQAICVPVKAGKRFMATRAWLRFTAMATPAMTVSVGTNSGSWDDLCFSQSVTASITNFTSGGHAVWELMIGTNSTALNRWRVLDVGTDPIRLNITSAAGATTTGELIIEGFYI